MGAGCLAGAAFICPRGADAALVVNLNGATTITDNGAGDNDPATGRIVNTSVVAGFGIAISIAESTSPGTATAGLIQISSLLIENQTGAPGTLTITTSDTNFSLPGSGAQPMNLESDIGGTFALGSGVGNSVAFQSFADPANGQPAAAVATPVLTFIKATTNTSESFSGSNTSTWTRAAGPYSLADKAVITLSPGGQVNISGTTTAEAVPEPGSFALLGVGALALARRRKAR